MIDKILHFVLVTAKSDRIGPIFQEYNPLNNYPILEYGIVESMRSGTKTESSLSYTKCRDERGEYWKVLKVCRTKIDATCLRVCRKIYADGIDMFYSNEFIFHTHRSSLIHRSPLISINTALLEQTLRQDGQDRELLLLRVTRLEKTLYQPDFDAEIQRNLDAHTRKIARREDHAYRKVWKKVFPQMPLPMLVKPMAPPKIHHYDIFLWFLSTIGPKNVARLTSLRFFSPSYKETLYKFDCYIKFMKVLCPNLKSLKIDTHWFHTQQDMLNWRTTRSVKLERLLKGKICNLTSLDELVVENVVSWPLDMADKDIPSLGNPQPIYASKTVEWIKKQGEARRSRTRKYYAYEQRRAAGVEEQGAYEKFRELLGEMRHVPDDMVQKLDDMHTKRRPRPSCRCCV